MGDDTVNVTTKNRPRFLPWFNLSKQSEAEHPHRRPLMLAQEVARMDPSEQIVLRGGMLPLKSQRACWFNDRNFTTLVRQAPEIPRLDVKVALDDGQTTVIPGAKTLPTITSADVEPEMSDEEEVE
jgi:type IV secretion system protein VirD4